MTDLIDYRDQHKLRLSYMPWLYYRLKPRHRAWAQAWQVEIQTKIQALETVSIGKGCFIAPEARLFAEPGRPIVIGDGTFIGADAVIHGPVDIGRQVAINHHVTIDGGRKGVVIGDQTRIAAYCTLYAFDHGMSPARAVFEQPVTSQGIVIGRDVWLGARVGVVDGVLIGDGAVVGMGSVVTGELSDYTIAAGSPARAIGDRRLKK